MQNKIREAFDPVKADEQMKNDVKEYLKKQPQYSTRKSYRTIYQIAAAAICACLVMFGASRIYSTKVEAASIEIQGDSQILLSLNSSNQVIQAKGINDSGENVVKTVDVVGMTYEEALKTIVSSDVYEEQETGTEEVQFDVNCSNQKKETEIQQTAEKVCRQYCKRNNVASETDSEAADTIEDAEETSGNGHHAEDGSGNGSGTGSGNGNGNGNGSGSGSSTSQGSGSGAGSGHGSGHNSGSGHSGGNGGGGGNGHHGG